MADAPSPAPSPLRWLLAALVFIVILFAVKMLLGVAMALFKWLVIGAVALLLTGYVLRRLGGGGDPRR